MFTVLISLSTTYRLTCVWVFQDGSEKWTTYFMYLEDTNIFSDSAPFRTDFPGCLKNTHNVEVNTCTHENTYTCIYISVCIVYIVYICEYNVYSYIYQYTYMWLFQYSHFTYEDSEVNKS